MRTRNNIGKVCVATVLIAVLLLPSYATAIGTNEHKTNDDIVLNIEGGFGWYVSICNNGDSEVILHYTAEAYSLRGILFSDTDGYLNCPPNMERGRRQIEFLTLHPFGRITVSVESEGEKLTRSGFVFCSMFVVFLK